MKEGHKMNEGNRFRFDLWLYNEMQKRGWEPLDLAIETGLSVPNIRNYLKNRSMPTLRSLELILRAFDMHMEFVKN